MLVLDVFNKKVADHEIQMCQHGRKTDAFLGIDPIDARMDLQNLNVVSVVWIQWY